ncbi:MAG TPA: hypothetical protein VHY75_16735 [Steroidobacteraceae bacterium]|jgi:hypothetical protein|nr:hypothetical protein [Steroidobacteraceae bacterium]
MTRKNTAVFGIYPTADAAERAVDTLIRGGFPSGDISVLLPDIRSSREFAHQKETKAPEGTTAGVTAGGVIGGTLGVLAGVGALAIPGLGPVIAAGPILAGFAGLGVGGAVGGLVGALIGMGIPEYEAKRCEGRVRAGGTLLSVHCESSKQIRAAKNLLRETGAQDIASAGESPAADPADRRATTDPRYTSDPRVARDPRYIPHQDPYVSDPADPADPYHPRIYR